MRFNGVDLTAVHHALSISKEIPPGMPARDIATVGTSTGEMVTNVTTVQDEYRVRVNVAARTYDEAMTAREALAAWAMSSGKETAPLEPTHMPGRAYKAIWKSTSPFENRFDVVEVVFLLPKPMTYEVMERSRSGTSVKEVKIRNGGTAPTQPNITYKPDTDASGLTMAIDGSVFFAFRTAYTLKAGAVLEVNMHTGAVTVDGVHAEENTSYTECDFDAELTPGEHTISVSTAGTLTARWNNEWL